MHNMKIKKPQPFTFEAGNRSVLLLHGFTGHTADVRMLGRFLEKKGYTSHAPIYRGHGGSAEDTVAATAEEWWEDAQDAYPHVTDLADSGRAESRRAPAGEIVVRVSARRAVKRTLTM